MLTYAWDLDGDGTYETLGQQPVLQAGDSLGTRTLALHVCDPFNLCMTASTTLTVVPLDTGGSDGGPGGPPPPGDTPELDSLVLFGSGSSGGVLFLWKQRRHGKR